MRKLSIRNMIIILLLFIFVPTQIISYAVIEDMFNQQMEESKQTFRQLNNAAFDEFLSFQFEDLIIFAEDVVFLGQLEKQTPKEASQYLNHALSRLQSSYPLLGGYLIGPTHQKLAFGTPPPLDLSSNYSILNKAHAPQQEVNCANECSLNITIPISMHQQLWGLMFSVNLTDSLIQFSRLRNTDLGLLMDSPPESIYARSWHGRAVPILTNSNTTQVILNQIKEPTQSLFKNGTILDNGENLYFVWGHEYVQSNLAHFKVLFFEDYTSQKEAQAERAYAVVWFMISVISALFIGVLFVTANPINRLANLTTVVKQIGKKHYTDAIKKLEQMNSDSYFQDEIFTVQKALKTTASNLEKYETQLKESNTHLEYIASHDQVTGLLNRYALSHNIERLRTKSTKFRTLLLLDIKGFNEINDNLGHEIGDSLLKEIGNKLETLSTEIQVYRYGGDEFMLLCRSPIIFEDPELLVKQLKIQIKHITIKEACPQEIPLQIAFTCGISKGNSNSPDFSKLPIQADMALHEAKYHSGNFYEIYTTQMEEKSIRLFQIRSDFEASLSAHEFFLTYQPIINFKTRKLIKMEALVRWHHNTLGPIFPDQFIPILEESGQIELLTDWLIIQASETIMQLDEIGLHQTKISVNISGVQVSDEHYIDHIVSMLKEKDISLQRIELEITETSLISDFKTAQTWVAKAKKYGFSVVMDDFGTGYSSLSYLTSISFDTVKLDRSLISDIATSKIQENVVATMIRMLHDLGIRTVAEGVEDRGQFNLLTNLNCDLAQGYLISKPVQKKVLFTRLKEYHKDQCWFSDHTY